MEKYKRLPDSELDIMLILWNGHPDMSRLEVQTVIRRKKPLAATTVQTLLTRLEKKKFVSCRKDGQTNRYTPLISREAYQHAESKSTLERLYGNSLENFIAALYTGKTLTSEKKNELDEFIQTLESKEE
ncbi:MAG: BlaI/MecI/CopY family transcriptional regulator [Lachnospiraceae bacterium]|nr:BlaI/MecI/CopY family transcriptional regulator [Lachnospiraceae bacterium]